MNIDYKPFYENGYLEMLPDIPGIDLEQWGAPDGVLLRVTAVRSFRPNDPLRLRTMSSHVLFDDSLGTPLSAPYKLIPNLVYRMTFHMKLVKDLPEDVYAQVESGNKAKEAGIFMYSPYYRKATSGYLQATYISGRTTTIDQYYPIARLRFGYDSDIPSIELNSTQTEQVTGLIRGVYAKLKQGVSDKIDEVMHQHEDAHHKPKPKKARTKVKSKDEVNSETTEDTKKTVEAKSIEDSKE